MRIERFVIPYPEKFAKFYGLNAIYSGKHWSGRSKDKAHWQPLVWAELVRQGVLCKTFDKPVSIAFFWNDRLDLDNSAYMRKLIIDGLKGLLLVDDSKRYVQALSDGIWNGNGIRVEVRESDGDEKNRSME